MSSVEVTIVDSDTGSRISVLHEGPTDRLADLVELAVKDVVDVAIGGRS